VILRDFFTSFIFLSLMSEYYDCATNVDLGRYDKLNLSQLYQELTDALHSKNVQSIWELSKVITRVHFRDSNL
jgi:hypothetical protein